MKASDLLGRKVFTTDGAEVGKLFDIEAQKTGPLMSEAMGNALQVSALIVGPRAFLLRLGFKRRAIRGPVGAGRLAKRLKGFRVRWDQIAAIEEHRIILRCNRDDLSPL